MATRKETLLIEIYNLRNQICELKGKEQTNIVQFTKSTQFYNELRTWKEYQLKVRLEQMQELLEQTKHEVEVTHQRENYYSTTEGQARKAELEQQLQQSEQEWQRIEQSAIDSINARLQTALGEQWAVINYQTTNLRLGVKNNDATENRDFIFGQEVEIYYNPRKRWNEEGERFEMNFGSCGSFDILPENNNGSFAEFHIGIGRLLADQELCQWLQTTLRTTRQQLEQLGEEIEMLRQQLNNPTQA
jgi:Tfp pilus assembly protein PilE